LTYLSLKATLEANLPPKEYKRVQSLCMFIDLLNIKTLFQEEEIDTRGNLLEEDLDAALLDRTFFPEYVFDFLQKYETLTERLHHFPSLLAEFFREEEAKEEGFLKKYFSFEREVRLVLLAIRSKRANRDLVKELQFEDPTDSFVLHILAQKDAEQYEPPFEYKEIKELMLAAGSDPWEQNKAITAYRFQKVEEMVEAEAFSIDTMLSYLVRLMLVEYWHELDKDKGQIILSTIKKR
jgi:hypothetical protein